MIIRVRRLLLVEDSNPYLLNNAQIEIDDEGKIVGIGKVSKLRFNKKFNIVAPQFMNNHVHILDLDLRKYFKTMYIDDVVGAPYGIKYLYINTISIENLLRSIEYSLDVAYRTGTGELWIVLENGLRTIELLEKISRKFPMIIRPFLEPSKFHLGPWEDYCEDIVNEVQMIVEKGYDVELISPLNYNVNELKEIEKIVHSRDKMIMTHVSETLDTSEERDLDLAIDVLKADVLVHCVHVRDLSKLQDRIIVVTPRSNLALVGKFNVEVFKNVKNVRVGTDNVGLNDPDMWSEVRVLLRSNVDPYHICRSVFMSVRYNDVARFQVVYCDHLVEKDCVFLRRILWMGRTLGRIDGKIVRMFY
ncbi:MAG: hypothetical protein GXO26_04150 [Crenarchaeota archaeon]|nr:hypothetical protein [Thermoproteota archaeon]